MTVVKARPNEPPSCTSVWKSAESQLVQSLGSSSPPATDCSPGNAKCEMNSVPVAMRLSSQSKLELFFANHVQVCPENAQPHAVKGQSPIADIGGCNSEEDGRDSEGSARSDDLCSDLALTRWLEYRCRPRFVSATGQSPTQRGCYTIYRRLSSARSEASPEWG